VSNDIASLGLKVDSSQVTDARQELDKFEDSAVRAEKATTGVGTSSESAAKAVERHSGALRNTAATLSGLDPRLRSVAGLVSRLGVGFVATAAIGAAVGAVAALVKAYIEGASEAETFAKAIYQTGDAAGVTTGRLALMSSQLSRIAGTQHEATEALAAFVATGKVGADDLERFAALALRIKRDIGTPIEETAKAFAALGEKPAEAAVELQKQFNFLTPAILNYVRAQVEAGNVTAAAAAVQRAYAGAQERSLKQVEESIPPLVKHWRELEAVAKKAWDTMLNIGRSESDEEKLSRLLEAQTKRLALPNGGVRKDADPSLQRVYIEAAAAQDAEIARLSKIVEERKKAVEAQREQKDVNDAYAESLDAAANSAEAFRQAQEDINQAWRAFDVSAIERNLESVKAKFDDAGAELDAQRSANLIADKKYYDERRRLIERSAAAEIKALQAVNAVLADQDGQSAVERVATQAKIAANQQKIADIRQHTASQLHVVATQETDDINKTAAAYAEAQQAADRYVATLTKRFQIESRGLGLGEEARQRMRERADLEARFQDRRDEIERDHRRGQIKDDEYERLLAIEEDALKRSEQAYEEHYKILKEKQGDWVVGAQEAFANFRDKAQDVAGQVEDAFSNAFEGITDALVQFAMTGKADFKGLINSILADLLRIELRIIASKILQNVFAQGGAGASGSGGNQFSSRFTQGVQINPPGRAGGGPVNAGSPYLIGENGPEIMVPDTPGWVIPNSKLGGAPVMQNVFHFGPGSNVATTQAMVERAMAELENRIYQNMDRGRWKRVTG
jgi:lambda family phage tail tape measure protein